MTGLPPRRFPAPPGVALGGKVQLRGSNVGNLDGGAEKGGKKKPQTFLPDRALRLGCRESRPLPRRPRVPGAGGRAGAAPGRRRGAERCGGGREGGGRAFGLLPGEEK